ncbi:MAG: hypothetical protein JJ850_15760 [Kordiimonadaceae bacterium]|nr:hypothetical protein [Kordiimonadaceae bacterium]MBO6569826.1 hypothetical protein [Kordiimonadaceae bacterium]MBO6966078.1 hypothetical protein [Kordiimonadaceae bacterium]
MRAFLRKHQKTIGLLFIAVAVVLFIDKAVDLGSEAVSMLGEIMLAVVFFTVGYVFVVQPMGKGKSDTPKEDE